jgi:hypothetical protein
MPAEGRSQTADAIARQPMDPDPSRGQAVQNIRIGPRSPVRSSKPYPHKTALLRASPAIAAASSNMQCGLAGGPVEERIGGGAGDAPPASPGQAHRLRGDPRLLREPAGRAAVLCGQEVQDPLVGVSGTLDHEEMPDVVDSSDCDPGPQ